MNGGDRAHFGEGLRLMARLALAKSAEDVVAQVEYIGLYALGVTARRCDVPIEPGTLRRVDDLQVGGVSLGPALVAGVDDVALVWAGQPFDDGAFELLAPVIPLAQRTLDALVGRTAPQPRRVRGSDVLVSALVESIEDPVWLLDDNLRLQAFNTAFERLFQTTFGLTPVVGNSVLGTPEPYRSQHQKLYRDVMDYGPRRLDWHVPGSETVLDVFLHPIRAGERVTGVAVTCRDVSRDRSAARALEAARASAERANRAKTDFLAQMSHEIRTPLNAIIGLTELAGSASSEEPVRDLIQRVQHSSKALLHLVSGVLDFSRIEAGRLQVDSAPMDLRATLHDVVQMLEERALLAGLTLRLELPDDLPARVRSDTDRVRQIVVGLVDNALKYTERGQVVVRARVEEERLVVEVEDTGTGIRPDQLQQIFRRFVRLEDHRHIGGTGLGLAIARALAEALGGELDATSTPGHGSCFRLMLPLDVVRWGGAAGTRRQSGSLRRRLHILVADDAPTNLAVTRALLERAGHTVVCVASGAEALDLLGQPFDLVLMDLDMPGVEGREATRRWRASGDDTPIVALTAHAVPEVLESCLEAGMQGWLVKPVAPATLDEEVLRYARPPRIRLDAADPEARARAVRWLEEVGALVVDESRALAVEVQPGEARAALLARVEGALTGS